MLNYIVKRLSQGFLLIIVVSFLIFSMMYLMPGDPITLMAGPLADYSKLEELKEAYGLNRPLVIQYIDWMKKIIFNQDFGMSLKYRLPVWDLIKVRIPISLKLTGMTMLIQNMIAIPLGLLCAYKKDSLIDRIIVVISLVMTAIPSFWISVLLILFFGVRLQWLPLSGYETARHYVLPVAAAVLGGLASTIRFTKSEAVDVFREKYVTTAYAKGLTKKTVIIKHVLRNALIVIVVMLFMSIPWLISGSIIIENIFGIPGMGNLMINSIVMQDFNVVQGIALIVTVLTVFCNILSDIVLGIIDPRIRIAISGGRQ